MSPGTQKNQYFYKNNMNNSVLPITHSKTALNS
jgi:hypothetical protein